MYKKKIKYNVSPENKLKHNPKVIKILGMSTRLLSKFDKKFNKKNDVSYEKYEEDKKKVKQIIQEKLGFNIPISDDLALITALNFFLENVEIDLDDYDLGLSLLSFNPFYNEIKSKNKDIILNEDLKNRRLKEFGIRVILKYELKKLIIDSYCTYYITPYFPFNMIIEEK